VVVKNFLVGAAVVGVLVVGAAPVKAALSLTLSDGNPLHEQVLTDSGSPGSILFVNGTVGDWSIGQFVGVSELGEPLPVLDLNYLVRGNPGNSSILTVTLTETGYKRPGASIGDILLALGGIGGSGSVAQSGLINGSAVGVQGAFNGVSYHGDRVFTFSPLEGDEFAISEQLVFMGTGQIGGDAVLGLASVPEPGTAMVGVFAGVCGLGAVTVRAFKVRKG